MGYCLGMLKIVIIITVILLLAIENRQFNFFGHLEVSYAIHHYKYLSHHFSDHHSVIKLQPSHDLQLHSIINVKMLNCSFTSVGHLIVGKPNKNNILRYFTTIVFCNLGDDLLDKSAGYLAFADYIRETDVDEEILLDNFAKYFKEKLIKCPELNERNVGLSVEKLVWSMFSFRWQLIDKYCVDSDDRYLCSVSLFRLFCLFNRYSNHHDRKSMILYGESKKQLADLLGIPIHEGRSHRRLRTFADLVETCAQLSITRRTVKSVYDAKVRQVVLESRIACRIIPEGVKKSAYKRIYRSVTLTPEFLTIYNDDPDDLIGHQPYVYEPSGPIAAQLPINDSVKVEQIHKIGPWWKNTKGSEKATMKISPSNDGSRQSGSKSITIELEFNSKLQDLFAWGNSLMSCIKDYETKIANNVKEDRLAITNSCGSLKVINNEDKDIVPMTSKDNRTKIIAITLDTSCPKTKELLRKCFSDSGRLDEMDKIINDNGRRKSVDCSSQ